ncbi:SGNH/GDSL hydrolase family protein [Nocardioides sp.]|uniref:SGNH/GDSL hydrolase family protein n=1 Tax=Nocardioides sp. TaxID=35761 RepID=UPI0026306989|nr:SGNH/GDSL hydrolase family protein [Nocardioides sp.]MDI6912296.1 SGNH/GDSL hydrolase family protein [Nocardioides sp.]
MLRPIVSALAPALAPALALALGLSGCTGSDEPVAAPARSTGSPTAAPTQYDQYVALGDSYTAAPLVPPTDGSSICLRSGVNYPALVARALPGTELTDVSCSGARTANVTSPQAGQHGSRVPPQLAALRPGTDLVTIGLGGNDDHLFGGVLGRCVQLASSDPTGAPCRAAVDESSLTRTFEHIRDNLAGVVETVRGRSPHARILLVGYPQVVPGSGSCDLLPLADGDYAFARSVTAHLNDAVRRAADETSVEYVDLWGPSAGHDICADDPWVNGRVTSAETALAYHPLAAGQRAAAEQVLAQLR